jgi:hypothetical protein
MRENQSSRLSTVNKKLVLCPRISIRWEKVRKIDLHCYIFETDSMKYFAMYNRIIVATR